MSIFKEAGPHSSLLTKLKANLEYLHIKGKNGNPNGTQECAQEKQRRNPTDILIEIRAEVSATLMRSCSQMLREEKVKDSIRKSQGVF